MFEKIKIKLSKKFKEAIFSSAVADGKRLFPEEKLFDEIDDLDDVLRNIKIYKIIYINSLKKLFYYDFLGYRIFTGSNKKLLNWRWTRYFGDLQAIQDFQEAKKHLIYYEKHLLNYKPKVIAYQDFYLGIFSLSNHDDKFISDLDILNLELAESQYKNTSKNFGKEKKIINLLSKKLIKHKFNTYFISQICQYFDYDKRILELVKDLEINKEELKKYLFDDDYDVRKGALGVLRLLLEKGKDISSYEEGLKECFDGSVSEKEGALEVLRVMLEKGKIEDMSNYEEGLKECLFGRSRIVRDGALGVLRLLLEQGKIENISIYEEGLKDCFDGSVSEKEGALGVLRLLLEQGKIKDISIYEEWLKECFDGSVSEKEGALGVLRLLLEQGKIKDISIYEEGLKECLFEKHGYVGSSILLAQEILKLMIEKGKDISYYKNQLNNFLFYSDNKKGTLGTLGILKLLLEKGKDINDYETGLKKCLTECLTDDNSDLREGVLGILKIMLEKGKNISAYEECLIDDLDSPKKIVRKSSLLALLMIMIESGKDIEEYKEELRKNLIDRNRIVRHGALGVLRLLLEKGKKDINYYEKGLKECLIDNDIIVRYGALEVLKLMLERGKIKDISIYKEGLKECLIDKDTIVKYRTLEVLRVMLEQGKIKDIGIYQEGLKECLVDEDAAINILALGIIDRYGHQNYEFLKDILVLSKLNIFKTNISDFLESSSSGSYLLCGYRGVGKSSLINCCAHNYNQEYKKHDTQLIPVIVNVPEKTGDGFEKNKLIDKFLVGLYKGIKDTDMPNRYKKKFIEQYERVFFDIKNSTEISKKYQDQTGFAVKGIPILSAIFIYIAILWIWGFDFNNIFSSFNISKFILSILPAVASFLIVKYTIIRSENTKIEELYNPEIAEQKLSLNIREYFKGFDFGFYIRDLKRNFYTKCRFIKKKGGIKWAILFLALTSGLFFSIYKYTNIPREIGNQIQKMFITSQTDNLSGQEAKIGGTSTGKDKTISIAYTGNISTINASIPGKNAPDKNAVGKTFFTSKNLLYINISFLSVYFIALFVLVIMGILLFGVSGLAIFAVLLFINIFMVYYDAGCFYTFAFGSILVFIGLRIFFNIPYFKPKYKFMFVIDELDKLLDFEKLVGNGQSENTKASQQEKTDIKSIFQLLSKLKIMFFDTVGALFFVVTNKDAYDYYLTSKHNEDDMISNIFSKISYLPMNTMDQFNINRTLDLGDDYADVCKYIYFKSHGNRRKARFIMNEKVFGDEIVFDRAEILLQNQYYTFIEKLYNLFQRRNLENFDNPENNINKNDIYKIIMDDDESNLKSFVRDDKYNNFLDISRKYLEKIEIRFSGEKQNVLIQNLIKKIDEIKEIRKGGENDGYFDLLSIYIGSMEKIIYEPAYKDYIINTSLNICENLMFIRKANLVQILDNIKISTVEDFNYPVFEDMMIYWLPYMLFYMNKIKANV